VALVAKFRTAGGIARPVRPGRAGPPSGVEAAASRAPLLCIRSQPELGTNTVSLRAPNRPLSGSMAFMGHLGLNTVQKSKGKAKNPLNGARQ
jgi:hypothetical protein